MSGFKIVSRYDEALDAQAMGSRGIAEYRETADFSQVRIREGMTATVFHCRRLTVSEMQSVKSATDVDSAYVAAFARGVERVEALRPLEPSEEEEKNDVRRSWVKPDKERSLSMREIDAVFAAGDVFEVGAAIYGRSILGKARPAAWPLPATSRLAVEALVHRLVARMPETAAPSGPSKSEAEGQQVETASG